MSGQFSGRARGLAAESRLFSEKGEAASVRPIAVMPWRCGAMLSRPLDAVAVMVQGGVGTLS